MSPRVPELHLWAARIKRVLAVDLAEEADHVINAEAP